MILSVSRRTDIPSFYSDWFMNRLREGFVYTRNPMNHKQISEIKLSPENIDCIVFWTKDPLPFMKYLDEIDKMGYKYYFQFTITPYGKDIESNIRDKKEIINTFIELSSKIGKEKVILKYDPILLTDSKYTLAFHSKCFEKLCSTLENSTEKIVISFLDEYRKINRGIKEFKIKKLLDEDYIVIAKELVHIANFFNLPIETCAEKINLSNLGINHSKCIDGDLIEKIVEGKIKNKELKDGNREDCGCMKCIDIGQYDTCIHGCMYCYANVNKLKTKQGFERHNPKSPILLGDFNPEDIKRRKDIASLKVKEEQVQLLHLE